MRGLEPRLMLTRFQRCSLKMLASNGEPESTTEHEVKQVETQADH